MNPKRLATIAVIVVGFLLLLNYASTLTLTSSGKIDLIAPSDGITRLGSVEHISDTFSGPYPSGQPITASITTRISANTPTLAGYTTSVVAQTIQLKWNDAAGAQSVLATFDTNNVPSVVSNSGEVFATYTSSVTIPGNLATSDIMASVVYDFKTIANTPSGQYTEYISEETAYGEVNIEVIDTRTGYTWTVTVLDKADDSPIANAKVTFGALTGYTNSAGSYVFADVPAGVYTQTVTATGYTTISRSFTVFDGTDEGATTFRMTSTNEPPVITEDYVWTTTGIAVAAGGILGAILIYAFAPIPPNTKALIAVIIAVAGVVAAHFINTGVI